MSYKNTSLISPFLFSIDIIQLKISPEPLALLNPYTHMHTHTCIHTHRGTKAFFCLSSSLAEKMLSPLLPFLTYRPFLNVSPSRLLFHRTSRVVQQLRLQASNARGTGLLPGQGTKIPHATLMKRLLF